MDIIEETGKLSLTHMEPLKDLTNAKQLNDDTENTYKKLMSKAKRQAAEGHPRQALDTLQQVLKIDRNDKVLTKIRKLEAFIKEYGQSSEEEEEDDTMMHVGKGFYLHRDLYLKLYPHQKEGVLWFWRLHRKNKGGILGDDMGLGKTIQVVSFLSGLFDADEVKSVMIILPVALIINWEREFEKWAPGIRVESFHTDSKRQRQRVLEKVQRRGGVLLISYGLVVTNCDNLKTKDGYSFTWDYVILDEGHKIKNPTKTTKAVHAIAAQHRFILSGTPVQNNLKELWSLFDFVCQGTLLGTRQTFCSMYENPITRAREKCGTASEKLLGNEMAESLRRLIAPHFLRRTKADVKKQALKNDDTDKPERGAEMPTLTRKNDLIVWMHLSQTQIQIYQEFVSLDRVKELLMTTRSPLVELTILKKICDHPRLLSTMACQQLGLEEFLEVDESRQKECAANFANHIPDNVLLEESGKLQFLMGLLEKLCSEGHRTLVFSQSRKMLDIIQKLLWSRDIKFLRLDGTIRKLEEREKLIKSFQENDVYSVFLLTTQVGGVGLTLTAADRVVVFDPHWNPATDNQAVDRVYRIGQTRSVVIYRLITCGSVEEKIYRRQVFKDSITRQTTGDTKNPYRYFTRQELHELFVLDDPKVSTTQQQLEELHTGHRVTDPDLDDHIAYLYSLGIFGLSDHDLMFSQEAAQESAESHENENTYIHETVQRAQTLVASECQLTQQIKEHYSGQNDDGQENQLSTGQYRDRFSLMNQLSRMQGKDVPEPPPPKARAPPTTTVPVNLPYSNNIDMVNVNFDAKEISDEDLNKTMESLTLTDHKGQNSTQEMIDVDEVIDLTDDSYISTGSSNHQTESPNFQSSYKDGLKVQASPEMEYIDLTDDQEEANASIQNSDKENISNDSFQDSHVESIKGNASLQNFHLENNESKTSIENSDMENLEDNSSLKEMEKFKHDDVNDNSSIENFKSKASIQNLQRSPALMISASSTHNSPAAPLKYLVDDSDEEDNANTTVDSNSAFQDDMKVNESFDDMEDSYQNIKVSEPETHTLPKGLNESTSSQEHNSPEQKSPEQVDSQNNHGDMSDQLETTIETCDESLMETEKDVATKKEESDLSEMEDLSDKRDEEVEERSDTDLEETERVDQNVVDENIEDENIDLEKEEKEMDETEIEEQTANESISGDEEENSMDDFIDDEEEDEEELSSCEEIENDESKNDKSKNEKSKNDSVSSEEERDEESEEEESEDEESEGEENEDEESEDEEFDPMYLQLVKEGRNQEKAGKSSRALKCYLKALDINDQDKALRKHVLKLIDTLRKAKQNQL
ncbi:DNA excision repair protein ERCC-6-like isoform X2 [Antedon mediterranea]